ncbi:DoxX family membrane protein [Aureisphaera galaxeae]|uniref:DoxX family membrane protein n=1 Tax=Aureisphaera galaxeae TaxID=1538023 RepID=UPI0023509699|nr:DoxX family membrane protein [Aureisphaera galaxeae]MDC8005164.1 DoxX family membrane protein [Aureisphaera galaxeae]
MKIFHIILRVGLGLMLLLFGFNKFFWFLQDFNFTGFPEAEHLFNALRYSGPEEVSGKGYIMHLVGLTEVVVGLLLVLKKWVPFALVMLVPISINIVLFHAFVNLPNIGPAILVAVLNAYLMYKNWDHYRPLFS